jgi:hypothetical protein
MNGSLSENYVVLIGQMIGCNHGVAMLPLSVNSIFWMDLAIGKVSRIMHENWRPVFWQLIFINKNDAVTNFKAFEMCMLFGMKM